MSRRTRIDSPANPRFRRWKRQAQGQVRKTGRTLVGGRRIVQEVATVAGPDAAWLVPDGFRGSLPGPEGTVVFELDRELFRAVDLSGTGYPLLDVPVEGRLAQPPSPLPPGIYPVLPLQDPVNVGAVARTALGLGAAGLLLLPSCAHPFHPRAVRSSAGAVFRLSLYELDRLDRLSGLGCRAVALDARGSDIGDFVFPDCCALVVGLEGPGLDGLAGNSGRDRNPPVEMSRVSLPARGGEEGIQSYNAAVAVALALWEWKRRREGRGEG